MSSAAGPSLAQNNSGSSAVAQTTNNHAPLNSTNNPANLISNSTTATTNQQTVIKDIPSIVNIEPISETTITTNNDLNNKISTTSTTTTTTASIVKSQLSSDVNKENIPTNNNNNSQAGLTTSVPSAATVPTNRFHKSASTAPNIELNNNQIVTSNSITSTNNQQVNSVAPALSTNQTETEKQGEETASLSANEVVLDPSNVIVNETEQQIGLIENSTKLNDTTNQTNEAIKKTDSLQKSISTQSPTQQQTAPNTMGTSKSAGISSASNQTSSNSSSSTQQSQSLIPTPINQIRFTTPVAGNNLQSTTTNTNTNKPALSGSINTSTTTSITTPITNTSHQRASTTNSAISNTVRLKKSDTGRGNLDFPKSASTDKSRIESFLSRNLPNSTVGTTGGALDSDTMSSSAIGSLRASHSYRTKAEILQQTGNNQSHIPIHQQQVGTTVGTASILTSTLSPNNNNNSSSSTNQSSSIKSNSAVPIKQIEALNSSSTSTASTSLQKNDIKTRFVVYFKTIFNFLSSLPSLIF